MRKIKRKGFTLLELITVLALLGALTSVALRSGILDIKRSSKEDINNLTVDGLKNHLELYYVRYNNFPNCTVDELWGKLGMEKPMWNSTVGSVNTYTSTGSDFTLKFNDDKGTENNEGLITLNRAALTIVDNTTLGESGMFVSDTTPLVSSADVTDNLLKFNNVYGSSSGLGESVVKPSMFSSDTTGISEIITPDFDPNANGDMGSMVCTDGETITWISGTDIKQAPKTDNLAANGYVAPKSVTCASIVSQLPVNTRASLGATAYLRNIVCAHDSSRPAGEQNVYYLMLSTSNIYRQGTNAFCCLVRLNYDFTYDVSCRVISNVDTGGLRIVGSTIYFVSSRDGAKQSLIAYDLTLNKLFAVSSCGLAWGYYRFPVTFCVYDDHILYMEYINGKFKVCSYSLITKAKTYYASIVSPNPGSTTGIWESENYVYVSGDLKSIYRAKKGEVTLTNVATISESLGYSTNIRTGDRFYAFSNYGGAPYTNVYSCHDSGDELPTYGLINQIYTKTSEGGANFPGQYGLVGNYLFYRDATAFSTVPGAAIIKNIP